MVGLHTGDGVMVWGRVSAFMGRLLMSIWKLWDKLVEEGYAADHVFTMNETGLIYRCMPWRSYLLDGCDSRQANDRVTLLFVLKCHRFLQNTTFDDRIHTVSEIHLLQYLILISAMSGWTRRSTNIGGIITFYFHISFSD